MASTCPLSPKKADLFVSDVQTTDPTAPEPGDTPAAPARRGAAPESGYTPRQIVDDDLGVSFADAIDATLVSVEDGAIVTGTVVRVDRDEVLLDIGYKSEGVIPSRELSIRNDVDPNEVVSLGDEIEALVLTKEDKDGRLVLSKKRAQYERAWGDIERIKEEDGVVSGPVIEVVKGGLILDIGLRGFLPASLVELRRVRDLQPYVGKSLEAKIIELDKNRNNVVLSRRAWLEETQREQREDFLANLKPGEVRKGVVSSVVNFGAFVDLGGMDGLIHVSELSWKHVDHPGSVVAVGDEVEVQVLDVDLSRERISLSLKATQQDPWQEFATSHRVGELVYGRVTKLVPFGAFVQVGDGIEGLVHISEMSAHHVDLPEQVVTPGEELWVKIIDLDLQRRRISLSIKQAAEGGIVAAEYQEHFGEHAYDDQGNYIGAAVEHSPEADEAWAEYYAEAGERPRRPGAGAGEAPARGRGRRRRGGPRGRGRCRRGRRRRGSPRRRGRHRRATGHPSPIRTKRGPLAPASSRPRRAANVRRRAGHRAHRRHRVGEVDRVGTARRARARSSSTPTRSCARCRRRARRCSPPWSSGSGPGSWPPTARSTVPPSPTWSSPTARRSPTSTPSSTRRSARRSPTAWRRWPRPTRSWSSTCRCWSSRRTPTPWRACWSSTSIPRWRCSAWSPTAACARTTSGARMTRQASRDDAGRGPTGSSTTAARPTTCAAQVDDVWAWIDGLRSAS